MPSIRIGEQQLAFTRPANLDEQLLAATGCSAGEIAEILQRVGTSSIAARALHVMLEQPMPLSDLAEMIAATDQPGAVAAAVSGMLVPPVLSNVAVPGA